MAIIFFCLALASLMGIYQMTVTESNYTVLLLMASIGYSLLLLATSLGLIMRKAWALITYIGFSLIFIVFVLYLQLGVLWSNSTVFYISLFLLITILVLLGVVIFKRTSSRTEKRGQSPLITNKTKENK
jgi:peptidoglycan/LPS O-acetylase OafA/YrhL